MANGLPDTLLDTGPDQEGAGPDLRALFVRGLSRSLGWVVLLTVLGAAVGLWFGVLQPNLYASNTKLLLRVGARELISSESMIGPEDEPAIAGPTMYDEIQMLSDVAIFEKVARTVGPQEVLRPADPARDDGPETPIVVRLMHSFQGGFFGTFTVDHECPGATCTTCLQQATKELIRNTSIDSEMGSNVIVVSFVSTSPEKAQHITKALADAFIERHREQFSIQALVEKNRPKVDEAKTRRDEAAIAYIEHLNRSGIKETQPQSPTYAAELVALEDKLWYAKLQLSKLQNKRAALTERAKDDPIAVTTFGPVVTIPNEKYESLHELKRNLVLQLARLPASDAARISELEAQIADVDDALATMPAVVSRATEHRPLVETEMSPGTVDLQLDEGSLELEIASLTARFEEKQAKAEAARRDSLMSDQVRKDLAAERDNAENRYKQMQDRFSLLEALSAIDIDEGANLRVLQTPTLERDKVGPKRVSLLLKGLIAGLLAGTLFAILRQRLDDKLRYPEAFEQAHGLPVLGVVPQLGALRRLPKSSAVDAD